jgi:hypothetical protein
MSSVTIAARRLRLDPKGVGFPYYTDNPPTISRAGWLLVLMKAAPDAGRRPSAAWACVWTKNIWVSTGAHIIDDWALISMIVFVAPLAATA